MSVRPTASAWPHHKHFSRLVTSCLTNGFGCVWAFRSGGGRGCSFTMARGASFKLFPENTTVLSIPREKLTILVRMGGQSVSNLKRERTPWIGVGFYCQLGMPKEKVILPGISLEWTGMDRRAAHSHPSEGQHAAAGDM